MVFLQPVPQISSSRAWPSAKGVIKNSWNGFSMVLTGMKFLNKLERTYLWIPKLLHYISFSAHCCKHRKKERNNKSPQEALPGNDSYQSFLICRAGCGIQWTEISQPTEICLQDPRTSIPEIKFLKADPAFCDFLLSHCWIISVQCNFLWTLWLFCFSRVYHWFQNKAESLLKCRCWR